MIYVIYVQSGSETAVMYLMRELGCAERVVQVSQKGGMARRNQTAF